jgi:SAM-dependent methyltransferase
MDEVTPKSQMAKIRNFEKGFMATLMISQGDKLGMFEALNEAKNGMTTPDLAAKLGVHEPYLKIWCQTAYHFHILDCDEEGRFRFQPYLAEILGDKSSYKNYLANFNLSTWIGQHYREGIGYFRSGGVMTGYNDPENSLLVYETTKNIHLAFLFMIFPQNDHLKQLLDQGVKLLDVGCGNGNLITQLAQAFQNSTFTGVNPDTNGIAAAKELIAQMGLEKRVSVSGIGGEEMDFTDEFDLASMVVTLHEIPPKVRLKAVQKTYQALKPNGTLMILDFPYPSCIEDFRNPIYDMGILDQFFETVIGTVHLTTGEQEALLTSVGFKDIQRQSIGKGMFELVTATK